MCSASGEHHPRPQTPLELDDSARIRDGTGTPSSHRDAVITEVAGDAYETGRATFTLDPRDPLGTGFVLR